METQTEQSVTPVTEKPVQELSDKQKAMMTFQHYYGEFVKKLMSYPANKKNIHRVFRALAQGLLFPIGSKEINITSPKEKELFNLFTEAEAAKQMLMIYGMEEAGAIEMKKSLTQMEEQFAPTEKKEEENGKTS